MHTYEKEDIDGHCQGNVQAKVPFTARIEQQVHKRIETRLNHFDENVEVVLHLAVVFFYL